MLLQKEQSFTDGGDKLFLRGSLKFYIKSTHGVHALNFIKTTYIKAKLFLRYYK